MSLADLILLCLICTALPAMIVLALAYLANRGRF